MKGSEHFLPFRKSDVVRMCLAREGLKEEDRERFRQLAGILSAHFHHEFSAVLNRLKDDYSPFDPDRDTRRLRPLSDADRANRRRDLVGTLTDVLERGNYLRVSDDEVQRSLVTESLFRIRLHIDFTDFEQILFFHRGKATRTELVPRLFGLRKKEVGFPVYERVAMYVHFRDAGWFRARQKENLPFVPDSMLLKLFSNIPCADLEMLFPNSEVRMKTIDKIVIGIPAVATGIFIVATKLAAVIGLVLALVLFWLGIAKDRPVIDSARLVALGAGLSAFASYVVKQWFNYKNRKIRFMKALTENLYFRNLDNNAGVLRTLVDEAESEEVKEAFLAYRFLLEEPGGLPQDDLDRRIEEWFATKWNVRTDFDVRDALAKLDRLGLARQEEGKWCVLPLPEALRHLDETWNACYDFGAVPSPERDEEPESARKK